MKKWLSRGIVLAMVVAMMVPAPVLAKSSKSGGKLIKEVTYYSYSNGHDEKYGTADDKYVPESKTTYKYDKKKNPSEAKTIYYNSYFLNVPVSGSLSVETYKYKYKGKNPVSMKAKNEVGFVMETKKYKKGKAVSYSGVSGLRTEAGTDGVERESCTKYGGSIAYAKNGLPKASCYVDSDIADGAYAGGYESNTVLFTVQKKGIPSYMFASGNWKLLDKDGKVESQNMGDGSGYYATFNKKGLVVQEGSYDASTNKYEPEYTYQYVMKKGNVAQAIKFRVTDGKEEAVGKYVFKYNKTKISKQRYMNMINENVECGLHCFSWY